MSGMAHPMESVRIHAVSGPQTTTFITIPYYIVYVSTRIVFFNILVWGMVGLVKAVEVLS